MLRLNKGVRVLSSMELLTGELPKNMGVVVRRSGIEVFGVPGGSRLHEGHDSMWQMTAKMMVASVGFGDGDNDVEAHRSGADNGELRVWSRCSFLCDWR